QDTLYKGGAVSPSDMQVRPEAMIEPPEDVQERSVGSQVFHDQEVRGASAVKVLRDEGNGRCEACKQIEGQRTRREQPGFQIAVDGFLVVKEVEGTFLDG